MKKKAKGTYKSFIKNKMNDLVDMGYNRTAIHKMKKREIEEIMIEWIFYSNKKGQTSKCS